MIGTFLIDGLRKLGDFLWEDIDYGGALIGALMELKVGGAGWGLDGVNLIHQAYKINKDGLCQMEELGNKRKWELYRLSYRDKYGVWPDSQASPPRRDPLVLDLNRDGKVKLKNVAFFDMNANGFHEKALLH